MTTIIDSEQALAQGIEALAADPAMAHLIALGARPPLRKRDGGFVGLAGIVVAQQLSTASAGAIWRKLVARFDPLTPFAILAASEAELRGVGLSAPKIRTLRSIAAAIEGGELVLDGLTQMPAEEAHAALCRVSGIGPWTADIYLLFCLGHPDILPAGDLALQEAARLALSLERRPSEPVLRALAERWRPWRGAAAYILWAYYRIAKSREGAPMGEAPPDSAAPIAAPRSMDGRGAARHPLLRRLEGGDRRSIDGVADAVAQALARPALVPVLVEGLFADDAVVRMRAADALEKVSRTRGDKLEPFADCFIDEVARSREAALGWNLALVLPRLALDAARRRRAIAVLMRLVAARNGLVRVGALQALADFAVTDATLAQRLIPILADAAGTGTAAVRARARKLKKRLELLVLPR